MSRQDHPKPPELLELPDTPLDRAVAAVREEDIPREAADVAVERVWARLASEIDDAVRGERRTESDPNRRPIESCDDYQALLPPYLAGELSDARALLVDEHTRHCLPCRKALMAARTGATENVPRSAKPRRTAGLFANRRARRVLAWAAVLGLAVVTGALLVLSGGLSFGPAPVLAEIETLEGTLLRPGDDSSPLTAGASLKEGERVRTAKGSGAVLTLTDGTRIEMSERAELALDRGFRGTTIQLDGGRIIVEAAEQKDGRLYVATGDCLVSVVGTVFSVNSGLKGSRVSVLAGEVEVARKGKTDVLKPGDQVTTDPMLAPVPLAREISWSRNSERYQALLEELEELRREMARRVPRPELRYASPLLARVPAETIGYLAVPNLSEALDETYRLLQEQLDKSPQMRRIWQQMVVEPGYEPQLESLITRVRDLGSYLGDEVVVTLPAGLEDEGGSGHGPLVMAQVVRRGFEAYLASEIERLNAEADEPILLLWSGEPSPDPGSGLKIWTDGQLLLASPGLQTLREAVDAARSGSSPFVGSAFHRRLADTYAEGVEWLAAVDLASVMEQQVMRDEGIRKTGLTALQHVLVERHSDGERTETGVEVFFDGPRRGVFSWLAEPAPMRSLDFVSPQAPLVLGLVTKEPVEMLEDLGEIVAQGAGAALPSELEQLQLELGVDLKDDVAAAVGGEMAFAVDGPVLQGLPWKLVLEVYDADRLQGAFERLARHAVDLSTGEAAWELSTETVRGRSYHVLDLPVGGEIHYTFTDAFLVAAPSRALLDRALQLRDSGTGIDVSEDFRALLPADGEANFSALFYQDTRQLTEALGEMGAPQLPPSLVFAYGRQESIKTAMVTPGDPLGFDWLLRMMFQLGAAQTGFTEAAAAAAAGGPAT